ncbi:acetyl-CoA carboxylase, carboxyltransferase subunit beta [Akkermansiaceae bacterium]|jgi:acetyl-CoA carboxylase carboxyl transferase subunit beta|nr:acetyl-CoA carboxylase carboxyltransferase subunit beta [Verrucomicrobiota bacterium]MBT6166048.1 acetyl-CoA carboxylase carboxyltransferase subunit beta [Verrucomicrobiota bacterium]MBT7214565.1 acetyl-CoA carboxylase carboxyltransferase subunit beta [Verrucomicrobiota bacterium]MDA7652023.1 acetyl-CoA carboxylase, carboxyltransferase subunit beta [Akkermansiaceae bacterium]MDB4762515.1 acetyl-CoA carboxylase, carboxyltransferase subunit beta [Akkermansiaceae bacterium]
MGIFDKPRLKRASKRRDNLPDDLWTKCPDCGELLHTLDLKQNDLVCTNCSHHFLMGAYDRFKLIADEDTFEETETDLISTNPLGFSHYSQKTELLRAKTGLKDAVVTGKMKIGGNPVMVAVMDFKFFAGSMGSVVGEKITRAIEQATAEKRAILIFSSSSGARMQEGMLSLMQMAKTCGALALHSEAKLPYISIFTHPTTGGVTASYATIGDINIAEPKCMIGFAGPRVVKETTHQDLPPGFQTAEFMLDHGLIDAIIQRRDLRRKLSQYLDYTMPQS